MHHTHKVAKLSQKSVVAQGLVWMPEYIGNSKEWCVVCRYHDTSKEAPSHCQGSTYPTDEEQLIDMATMARIDRIADPLIERLRVRNRYRLN